jgi:hypothetical protein
MSLCRRPILTPALPAANRTNARKSTGPRTVEGKNRVFLNALHEGRHARNFNDNLRRANSRGGRVVSMDSGSGAGRFSPSWLAGGREEGRAASSARLVQARTGRAPVARLRAAAGLRPPSPADCHSVGTVLDAPLQLGVSEPTRNMP